MNPHKLSPPELDAKRFSERLIEIHNKAGLLSPDDRDLLMLVAGFVRGQAARIRDLEGRLLPKYRAYQSPGKP